MFRIVLLFACLVACSAHAVLPLVHTAVAPYSHGSLGLGHGYAGHGFAGAGHLGYGGLGGLGYGGIGHLGYAGVGHHGYVGHGLHGHGYGEHHVLKRSPHIVSVDHLGGGHGAYLGQLGGAGHLGAVGHIGHVAPVAVSHQSRVDVRSSPALVAPVLPVVSPLIHAAAVPHTPLYYGGDHYGSTYSHLGHY